MQKSVGSAPTKSYVNPASISDHATAYLRHSGLRRAFPGRSPITGGQGVLEAICDSTWFDHPTQIWMNIIPPFPVKIQFLHSGKLVAAIVH